MSKLNRFQVGLAKFGEDILTEDMIGLVKEFLIESLATNEVKAAGVRSFDAFRYFVFQNRKKNIELENLPCTSSSIRLHIQCVFLQTHKWINASIKGRISLSR